MAKQQRASRPTPSSNTPPRANGKAPSRRRPRLEYLAAVRFLNGEHHLYSISNARNEDDVRRMVREELTDVASILVAL